MTLTPARPGLRPHTSEKRLPGPARFENATPVPVASWHRGLAWAGAFVMPVSAMGGPPGGDLRASDQPSAALAADLARKHRHSFVGLGGLRHLTHDVEG